MSIDAFLSSERAPTPHRGGHLCVTSCRIGFLRYAACVTTTTLALSRLLGTRVTDANGAVGGSVREVALRPQEDPNRVSGLVIKTSGGDRFLVPSMIQVGIDSGVHASIPLSEWPEATTLDD